MLNRLPYLLLILISGGIFGCVKKTHYSEIPNLTFVSYSTGDTLDPILRQVNKYVKIKFAFTDGDGDLGLPQDSTRAPYDYNVFATLNLNRTGTYEISSQEKSRIKDLAPYANKNGLEGTIEVTYIPYLPAGSKIKYDLYILDQALHRSNTISSPELILP